MVKTNLTLKLHEMKIQNTIPKSVRTTKKISSVKFQDTKHTIYTPTII